MAKQTLSNKGRYSVLKVSGFRSRMSTPQGRQIIKNRRKKGRKTLAISR
jgi:ribosomal protein L34